MENDLVNEKEKETACLDGWLLDLYEDERDGVRLWFITDSGERQMLCQPFPVVFYAYGDIKTLHACCLFLRSCPGVTALAKVTKQDVFKPEPICVLQIQVSNPVLQSRCFYAAKKAFPSLTWYDADLAVYIRHAAQYGTFPMALCHVEYDPITRILSKIVVKNSRWDLVPVLPVIRVAELIPNCDPQKKPPDAFTFSFLGRRSRISLDRPAEVVEKINRLTLESDWDLLLTRWGDEYIFPLLTRMAEESGIPLRLNRDDEREIGWKKEMTYFSYGQIVYRGRQAFFFGRGHLDTKNSMMWSDYKLDGTLEMARVTALPIGQASRLSPGSGISAMQMITALENNILVPEQKQQAEMEKTALDLIHFDRGGMIYLPKTGLYTDVAQIDFVSMYPSIIINGNISPEVPLPDGLEPKCEKPGIVPLTLKPLYEKRVKIKQQLLHFPDKEMPEAQRLAERASALKWLLVVCFGFLGYKNARFGRIESHEAVTRGGREALLAAKETAEEMGFEVLHMFVDALWIRKPGYRTVDDFQPVLDEISRRTRMLISMDGIYRWIAFLPSRADDDRPVPNRYFGVFKDGSVKIRGIEARRHDMPPWIIETQTAMLRCLSGAYDVRQLPEYLHKAFRILRSALSDLNANRVDYESLVLTLRVGRELESYKVRSAPVRAAFQLLEQTGKRVSPGQKIRFLYTTGCDHVRAWELPGSVDPDEIDKVKYRELLGKAAGTIFYPFGIDSKQLEDWAQGCLQFELSQTAV